MKTGFEDASKCVPPMHSNQLQSIELIPVANWENLLRGITEIKKILKSYILGGFPLG